MDPIQMVDLKAQYHKIKSEVDKAVIDVLESSAFINGKPVHEFAAALGAYMGSSHVIPCANGTDALQIAMMALDLQPGDEVITPSFTYIATTEVIALLRLKPVFVEVDPDTFCIDPTSLRKAITPRTKAIVPVHLYGHSAPMAEVMEIAREHGLHVIEDNAQAIGADYRFPDAQVRKAGTIGTIGTTSFFPSKNLGGYGDGGAIFTQDAALADKLQMIANHGQKVRYCHERVGCNSRLDTVQAAILLVKLRNLDAYIAARRSLAGFYNAAFAGIGAVHTPFTAPYSSHVYHQYTLKLDGVDRDALNRHLAEQGIPSMIYYPVPGHRQRMFESYGSETTVLPVTDRLTEQVISLPMHTEMQEEQREHIAAQVIAFVKKSS